MKKNINSPNVLTSIPCPKTQKLIERKTDSFTTLRPGQIAAIKEKGSWMEDVD
jgi:hypothetical protein